MIVRMHARALYLATFFLMGVLLTACPENSDEMLTKTSNAEESHLASNQSRIDRTPADTKAASSFADNQDLPVAKDAIGGSGQLESTAIASASAKPGASANTKPGVFDQHANQSSDVKPELPIKMKSIQQDVDGIVVDGENLNSVSSMQMEIDNEIITLSIVDKSETKIIARTQNALKLVWGKMHKMLFSTALGSEIAVPFYISIPDGSIPLSKLSSEGAEKGDVIEFDGKSWVRRGANSSGNQDGHADRPKTVVVKEDNQVLAHFLGFGMARSGYLMLRNGDIVHINLSNGEHMRFLALFFTEPNCQGKAYARIEPNQDGGSSNIRAVNLVVKHESGFYKATGRPVSGKKYASNWYRSGWSGYCQNDPGDLNDTYLMEPVEDVGDFSRLAPVKLELE